MRTKRRSFLPLALAAVLLAAAAAGCSNGGKENGGASGNTGHSDQAAPLQGDMSAWPEAEFTVMIGDPNRQMSDYDAPIVKQVFEKTKVHLKQEAPPANVDEKLNMMLASGEYPEVLIIDNPAIAQKYIDGGHVIPLDDLIEKYGGQFKENLGEDLHMLRNEKDGKIYHLPGWYTLKGATRYLEPGLTFQFLSDVLAEQGYKIPKTFDDIHQLLRVVKEKYPHYQPMSLALADESFVGSMMGTLAGAEGAKLNGSWVKQDDGKLVYMYKDEKIKDALRFLNKLWQEGLIDKESPIQNMDSLKAKLAGAKAFSSMGNWYDVTYEANTIFNQDQKPYLFKHYMPAAAAGVKTTYISYSSNYSGGWYMTKKNKDPERFMQFANWLNTYEGNIAQMGIWNFEGKNADNYDYYVAEEDGVPVYRITDWSIAGWGKDERFGATHGFFQFGDFTYNGEMSDHPMYKYKMSSKDKDFSVWWTDAEKAFNAKSGETGTDWIQESLDASWDSTDMAGLTLAPESDEGTALTKIGNYARNEIVKLIIADSDAAFEKGYGAFLKKIDDMGMARAEEAINQAYLDRKAKWGQ